MLRASLLLASSAFAFTLALQASDEPLFAGKAEFGDPKALRLPTQNLAKEEPTTLKANQTGVIPITKSSIVLEAPLGAFCIISFPFEILELTKTTIGGTSNGSSSGGLNAGQEIDLNSLNKGQTPVPTAQVAPLQQDSITVERGKNTITVFARDAGIVKFIVWRAEGYPVQFDLKIEGENKGLRYYEFKDEYGAEKKIAAETEANPHETAIATLIKAAYDRKPPRGYSVIGTQRSVKIAGLYLTNVATYVGAQYAAQEWNVKNDTDMPIKLYEEMFYEPGIFAVSFENDYLNPGENARMFAVRGTDGL